MKQIHPPAEILVFDRSQGRRSGHELNCSGRGAGAETSKSRCSGTVGSGPGTIVRFV
jgi:hypothetical protein